MRSRLIICLLMLRSHIKLLPYGSAVYTFYNVVFKIRKLLQATVVVVTLQRCGIAVSEKKFNVKLKKNAMLAMTLRRAKNREVTVRFALKL